MKTTAWILLALGYISLFTEPEITKNDNHLLFAMIFFAASFLIGAHIYKTQNK